MDGPVDVWLAAPAPDRSVHALLYVRTYTRARAREMLISVCREHGQMMTTAATSHDLQHSLVFCLSVKPAMLLKSIDIWSTGDAIGVYTGAMAAITVEVRQSRGSRSLCAH